MFVATLSVLLVYERRTYWGISTVDWSVAEKVLRKTSSFVDGFRKEALSPTPSMLTFPPD